MPPLNQQAPAFDMNAMMAAFAQAQLQQQREYLQSQQPRRLGMSGEDITNQKGPYDSGGIDWLKSHRMDPQQQAAQFEGRPQMQPPQVQNPMDFGQQVQQSPFMMPPPPQRNSMGEVANPQQALQNDMALYAPGGFRPQPWAPAPGDFAQVTQARPKPKKPVGFGASSSPRPGSSFGFGM